MWVKNCVKWYEYFIVHTDDFVIANKDSKSIMEEIQKKYIIKKPAVPEYLLGFDMTKKKNFWTFGFKTYVKQSIERVE